MIPCCRRYVIVSAAAYMYVAIANCYNIYSLSVTVKEFYIHLHSSNEIDSKK